jgi:hypothetical protein
MFGEALRDESFNGMNRNISEPQRDEQLFLRTAKYEEYAYRS